MIVGHGGAVVERGQLGAGLFEQGDRARVRDADDARAGVEQGGAGEALGIVALARDLRGRERRLGRAVVEAGVAVGRGEREQEVGESGAVEAGLRAGGGDRALVLERGLLIAELARRGVGGLDRGVDELVRVARREAVVRELGGAGGAGHLERLGDPAVQPRPAGRGQPALDRRAHERVGERVAAERARYLAEQARRDGVLERLGE